MIGYPAPVALFVYNRLEHTRRTVQALLRNDLAAETDVVVYSDGPGDARAIEQVQSVREYLTTIRGFRSIVVTERLRNFGLSKSIIDGVTDVVERYGRAIVVEDDIETAPFFLRYMNDALSTYVDESRVISIHGYMYPHRAVLPETFFLRGADCWGWATWQRGWALFNPDGEALLEQLKDARLRRDFNFRFHPFYSMLKDQVSGAVNSWAIRWYASAFLLGKLTLYPNQSLVRNTGLDGSGMNSPRSFRYFDSELATLPVTVTPIEAHENLQARRELEKIFLRGRLMTVVSAGQIAIRHPEIASDLIGRTFRRAARRSGAN